MGLFSGTPPGLQSKRRAALSVRDRPRQWRGSPTYWGIAGPGDLIPPRPFLRPNWPVVTNDTALRHSAVWACLRLRADLVSTLPVDVFTRLAGIQVESVKPPVLQQPDEVADWTEWCYSSQMDLDRAGNVIGIITKVDGYGRPKAIELQSIDDVTVQVRDGRLYAYKIGSEEFSTKNGKIGLIWHEKQFTLAGMHIGLSPVMYARWALSEYLTVQEFATNFFGNGAIPKAQLKNKAKILSPPEIAVAKEAWRAALATDEPLVTGSDWDYQLIQATEASRDWLNAKTFSITDICRYFGVPADMIDSTPTGQTRVMTYANVQQRHLQLLILNLGPAIVRREAMLTGRLLPPGKYVKLNSDALLRLDPQTRVQTIAAQITSRTLTPSEGRELENRPPFTDAQLAEFDRLFGPPMTGTGAYPAGNAVGASGFGPDVPLPEGDLVPSIEELSAHNGHYRELTRQGDWFR